MRKSKADDKDRRSSYTPAKRGGEKRTKFDKNKNPQKWKYIIKQQIGKNINSQITNTEEY